MVRAGYKYPVAVGPLNLECESEVLSDAQLSHQRKVHEDIKRLTNALKASGIPIGDPNAPSRPSQRASNGTVNRGGRKPHTSLTNGTTSSGSSTPVSGRSSPTNKSKRGGSNANRGKSPEIEVVADSKGLTAKASTSQSNSAGRGGGSNVPLTPLPFNSSRIKNLNLLNIVVRPRNVLTPSVAIQQRKELDLKVKTALMKSPSDFVEWLLKEGLIRNQQFCSIHKVFQTNQALKLKLGSFSDPKVLSTSGGYVWISECCGRKYVSVYSGSIFGSTPIDKVPPSSVLKLIYHWSCQTAVQNVEAWVKVEKPFVNKMYHYLRCICSVMLQDKVYDFGFDMTAVELGIVSLGTSTSDGSKKAVKVEILGLYDRKLKSYRLFASAPEPNNTSRQRFMRILKPIEQVVHRNGTIVCDGSIDKNCLHSMNYPKVNVCDSSDNESNPQSNASIMYYLRKHVPKLFQSALSQLSLEQVQLVLDELCWRERFGTSAFQSYNNMVEHIQYLTSREAENPGLLHLLDYVAVNPQKNWKYKTIHVPRQPSSIQTAVIKNNSNVSFTDAQVVNDSTVTPTINTTPKMVVGTVRTSDGSTHNVTYYSNPRRSNYNREPAPPVPLTEMEPYFYGTIPGNLSLGQEYNTCEFKCHQCPDTFLENDKFYTHLKWHLSGKVGTAYKYMCPYCAQPSMDVESLQKHLEVLHLMIDTPHLWCKICNEKFDNDQLLLVHMTRKHSESDLPYRCEVCQFASSIYRDVLDHFTEHHRGTPYVQCHLCLNVKHITPQGASSFSLRLYQHMQKHAQKNRCKNCVLAFYSKYMLQEHKNKDHISCSSATTLQRFKIVENPDGPKPIMFRPTVRTTPLLNQNSSSTPESLLLKPSVAISQTISDQSSVKLLIYNDDEMKEENKENRTKYLCIECDWALDDPQHFTRYKKCTRCLYSTSCRGMMIRHNQVFHPNNRSRNRALPYVIGPPIRLESPLYCICGFSTLSGNHMARHLVLCEGGRKSAYPTYANAMGIPETPSLDAILAAARAISEADPATSPPPTDLTAFMAMNMEVDEPKDAEVEMETESETKTETPSSPLPPLPLAVELEEGE